MKTNTMNKTKNGALKSLAVAGFIGACSMGGSQGALSISMGRISDSQVQIFGSGTVDLSGSSLLFNNISSLGNSGLDDDMTGSFQIGGSVVTTPNYPFILYETNPGDLIMHFTSGFTAGDAVAGTGIITLDVETWNAIGTSGTITIDGTTTGTYNIVAAVPEPSSTALLGLGGLALMLRRRR